MFNISNIANTVFFMLLVKTKRPSALVGRNVRLSNLLISSFYILFFVKVMRKKRKRSRNLRAAHEKKT